MTIVKSGKSKSTALDSGGRCSCECEMYMEWYLADWAGFDTNGCACLCSDWLADVTMWLAQVSVP